MRLVDKNCSVVDNLFHPESKIINQKLETLTPQQKVLSPYLHNRSGQALAKQHIESARRAVPGFKISTYSLDYLESIDLILPILEILAFSFPEMFNRLTTEEGKVLPQCGVDETHAYYGESDSHIIGIERSSLANRAIGYFEQVASVISSGIPANKAGNILLKADADIILQAVIDTNNGSAHGTQRFYQCCGIPMARYIADPRIGKPEIINLAYRETQKRIGNLPNIEMILLPISHLRFAYINESSLKLHEEISKADRVLEQSKVAKNREIRQASSMHGRDRVIDKYQKIFQQIRTEKQKYINELIGVKFSPFYLSGSPERLTQYDLESSEIRIQIPEDVMEMSLKSLSERIKKLLINHPERRVAFFR